MSFQTRQDNKDAISIFAFGQEVYLVSIYSHESTGFIGLRTFDLDLQIQSFFIVEPSSCDIRYYQVYSQIRGCLLRLVSVKVE
jgi:hypothetical protein